MKKNMGDADKIIRIVAAVVISVLYLSNIITGTVAIIAGIIAVIFVLTSFISFCPLYVLLGINTCKRKQR